MAKAKTQPTDALVRGFIAAVEPATRRDDAIALLELFERVTGERARMRGASIVGFGDFGDFGDFGGFGDFGDFGDQCTTYASGLKGALDAKRFFPAQGETFALSHGRLL